MRFDIFLLETIILTLVFTATIMIPLCKNPVWWIHDFPKDIQEVYFQTHERIPAAPLSKPALVKKSFAIALAIMLLSLLVWLCGARSFLSGFMLSYGLWFFIDWYDCFFLDWVLFANVKKIRLPGTEHMNKAYHQKTYHVIHSFIGMAVGFLPAFFTGLIIMLVA